MCIKVSEKQDTKMLANVRQMGGGVIGHGNIFIYNEHM